MVEYVGAYLCVKKKKNIKPVIEISNLTKNYITGPVVTKVLKGISIKIFEGEFVGIMGPSGSGKSTLLHQLGLLDNPTSGKIFINFFKSFFKHFILFLLQ